MESRKERFKRLTNIRVNNAIKQIQLVGNLSNKSSYEYSEEEVKKIFNELEQAIKDSKSNFSSKRKRSFQL